MGTLKINWLIASITAIILLFGAFVVVNAVEKNTPKEEKVHIPTWHFTGTEALEVLDASMWQPGSSPDQECTLDLDRPLPCQYSVHDEVITTSTDLINYFQNKYTSETEIRDNADSQKFEN